MIDLNTQEQQRDRKFGPIPAGSMVLCRLSLEKPTYPAHDDPYISMAKSGLRGLWVKIEVLSSTYAVSWYETMWLPTGMQRCDLDEGKTKACNMWGARIRAIVEANRNVMPKDSSPKAQRAREIASWFDLNGMEFPVRVGINKEPYTKGDKTYWNNTIAAVITPDKKEYADLMSGGEVITDGPVTGEDGKRQSRNGGDTGDGFSDDPGYEQPPASAYDGDVPF